jgi:hypothetical protein
MEVGTVSTMLRATKVSGGAYIGVGPEQNFSYIAAIRPSVAFVIDIRRQAVIQHLMFKALFELSHNRAEFISLTFSKPKPAAADTITNVQDLWNSYRDVATDLAVARRTYQRVLDHLTTTHQFTLTPEEIESLKWVWDAFTQYGPGINTQAAQGGGFGRGGANRGTFVTLTAQALDTTGVPQSFLSTDDNFKFVKSLHEKNLIIPVSGDFGGPKALRGIGAWLTKQNATVSAFYVSNVEQYLFMDGKQAAFYANAASLPVTATSVFIRPYSLRTPANGGFGRGGGGGVNFGPVRPLCPIAAYLTAFEQGRVRSNGDAVSCGG